MEAIRLDIVLNSTEAQAALADYATQLIRMGDTATVAADKVEKLEKAWGQGRARQQAKRDLDELAGVTTKTTTATDGLTSAVLRYAAPAAVGKAALETIRWADNIDEMAERTKLTVTQVQQLEKMAEKNGSTFGQMAGLIQAAEQRLASHNKKAEEAVRLMKLAPEQLLAMDPLERLRAIAKGLADLEDPAQRSAAEVAILGKAADSAGPALNALASGADKAEGALGGAFVQAGKEANDMLDDLINKLKDATRLFFLLPGVIGNAAGQMGKDSTLGTMFEMMGLHGSRASTMPGLPGAPGGGFGMPTPAGPIDPLGGQSQSFIEKALKIVTGTSSGRAASGGVTPYTANQWAVIQQVLGAVNPMGMGGLGSFPGWAPLPALASGGSPISFANGSLLAGTVGMNAPGGGGSWLSNLFKGKGANIAGAGLGILSNLIPGLSSTGSSIGAMAGSFLGPLGSGLGSLAGGLIGKLFGGSGDKKQLNALKGGDDFNAIKAKAEELGISMDKVFSAKKVEDFQKALKGVTDQITAQEGEQQKVLDTMEKWGLSIEDMGPKFKQTEMDKTAKSFTDDFMTLVGAGADVNTVIEKMGPSVGAFIQKAIEMGTTVPLEMKPIIEKMIEQGKLVDANGEKFTELGQIPFAQDLNKQFSSLIDKLDQLISKVFGLRDAFDSASDAGQNIDYSGTTWGEQAPGVSRGGVIAGKGNILYFGRGGFVPRGTDTQPAMLTPGEMVIARDQVKKMARGGGGGAPVNITLNISGVMDTRTQHELAKAMRDEVRREMSGRRAG